jgi:WD40 repeat protein
MSLRLGWWLAAVLLTLLTACRIDPPTQLEFASDPHILRGRYEGEIDSRLSSGVVALSGDGSLLALAAGDGSSVVQLWDTAQLRPIGTMGTLDPLEPFVGDVSLSADGARAATAYRGAAQIWDTTTGAQVRVFGAAGRLGDCAYCGVHTLDLSSDGRLLAVGGSAPTILLFDAATGALLREVSVPATHLMDLAFAADGSSLAALFIDFVPGEGTRRYLLKVWTLDSGTEQLELFGKVGEVAASHLAFSSDGTRVVFPTETALQVIEVATAETVLTLPFPPIYVQDFALNPDGSTLAVGIAPDGSPAVTLFYDVASGAELRRLEGPRGVRWSRDGRYLLTQRSSPWLFYPTLLDASDFTELGSFFNGQRHEVVLEATATYLTPERYKVAGTLRLDQGAAIAVSGVVEGNEAQRYIRPQGRLPLPASFTLTLQDHPWRLHGFQDWVYSDRGVEQSVNWSGSVTDTSQPPSSTYLARLSLERFP